MIDKNINLGIQIVPKSKDKEIYLIIDQAIEVIKQSGLKCIVTPMETVIEGTYDEIMHVIKRAQEVALADSDELIVNIRLHIRKDADVTFEEKTAKHA